MSATRMALNRVVKTAHSFRIFRGVNLLATDSFDLNPKVRRTGNNALSSVDVASIMRAIAHASRVLSSVRLKDKCILKPSGSSGTKSGSAFISCRDLNKKLRLLKTKYNRIAALLSSSSSPGIKP